MLELIQRYQQQAVEFGSRLQRAVFEIDPVVAARNSFIEARPLMRLVEQLSGPERILRLMDEEVVEMRDEERVLLSLGIPIEKMNGHRNATAVEASDVLMFAASGVHLLPQMKLGEKERWLNGVEMALTVGEKYRMDVVGIGVAIVRAKLNYNYPAWAFQLIPGEGNEAALQRNNESIMGLKAMRKKTWDGWLSPAILEAHGFSPEIEADPVRAHRFLQSQIGRV